MTTKENFVFFWGDDDIYSNFYPCTFVDGSTGIVYNCSEQYFMHQKAIFFDDLETAERIMTSTVPKVQKAFGRAIKNFDKDKWDKVSLEIMESACYLKFCQNPELKQQLLDTKNKQLVEASPFDKIWGIGMSVNEKDITDKSKWKGTNYLGLVLMKVKKRLR